MSPPDIEAAFRTACLAELAALKPGNVHFHAGGHGMEVMHFEAAAAAAAPQIARSGAHVGERIAHAVEASLSATGLNTNLGILLLCAPLAAAAERAPPLRSALADILAELDVEDAKAAFRAIAAASPGGLGRRADHDVGAPASITLREAMSLAKDEDRIARQYVTDFDDMFTIGIATLRDLGELDTQARTEAVYMAFLTAFPDSHITRKFGGAIAEDVRREALDVGRNVDWRAPADQRHTVLMPFDRALKTRGINPGTSADLTVATLFADALMR